MRPPPRPSPPQWNSNTEKRQSRIRMRVKTKVDSRMASAGAKKWNTNCNMSHWWRLLSTNFFPFILLQFHEFGFPSQTKVLQWLLRNTILWKICEIFACISLEFDWRIHVKNPIYLPELWPHFSSIVSFLDLAFVYPKKLICFCLFICHATHPMLCSSGVKSIDFRHMYVHTNTLTHSQQGNINQKPFVVILF